MFHAASSCEFWSGRASLGCRCADLCFEERAVALMVLVRCQWPDAA